MSPSATAVSLIKGMDVTEDGFELISQMIEHALGIRCSVLIGANLANEIALEQFSEATVGYNEGNEMDGMLFANLFNTPYFHVSAVADVIGCELCGTLKNIVAIGVGMVEGIGLGSNSKAAIMRVGLLEMRKLAQELFPSVKTETFFESAGVADLITTCSGGRNLRCAVAYTKSRMPGSTPQSWDVIEAEILKGMKLQGVLTSNEVQIVLKRRGIEAKYPLFTTINRISGDQLPPQAITHFNESGIGRP
eukprot:NODE_7070_length_1612_cov_7.428956.p1 GENE.NODE_7070_length_1612_cov_7.428956~~NODE_7070_length_1612_cov_7.428956.p1  ORF type:complete len:249 (-),score=87.21 NODE_7070_length_1612_cov_7.428956:482-1228(-)